MKKINNINQIQLPAELRDTMISVSALTDLLIKKGVITSDEVKNSIKETIVNSIATKVEDKPLKGTVKTTRYNVEDQQ